MISGARTIMKLMQPPASLFILILFGAILVKLSYRKGGRIMILLGISILYLLSTDLVAHVLVSPLEKPYGPVDGGQKGLQTVVVLNAGLQKLSHMGLGEVPTSESITRLVHGIQIYRKMNKSKLVISGKLGGELAKTAIDLGIKKDDLIWENRSANTYEGAINLKKILKDQKRIVLVTNARHMVRAISLHEKAGFEVIPSPSHYTKSDIPAGIEAIIPSASSLWLSSEALYEYYCRMWYGLVDLVSSD